MAQYWLGDPHFGHLKVSTIRGFRTPDDHDEAILNQLRELNDDDVVHFVGDMSSGSESAAEHALELLTEFKFTKLLYSGNHDATSSIHRMGWKNHAKWLKVFDSVRDFGWFHMENETVLVSHFPYAAIGDGDGRGPNARYLQFRLPDIGNPMIHAHTHQSHPFSKMRDATITKIGFEDYDLNSMCVSWDARRGLTSEKDVAEWLTIRKHVKKKAERDRVRSYWDAFPKPQS